MSLPSGLLEVPASVFPLQQTPCEVMYCLTHIWSLRIPRASHSHSWLMLAPLFHHFSPHFWREPASMLKTSLIN